MNEFIYILKAYPLSEGVFELRLIRREGARCDGSDDNDLKTRIRLTDLEGRKIDFTIIFLDPKTYGIGIRFKVETSNARIDLAMEATVAENWEYMGVYKTEISCKYRADFFDYHFSLKDHIRQMDTILRFSEGDDELATLFKTLRYEIGANMVALGSRIDRLQDTASDIELS